MHQSTKDLIIEQITETAPEKGLLTTRLGTLTLEVPRHRNEPFHTMVFENYKRSEAALIATLVQMVINGVHSQGV